MGTMTGNGRWAGAFELALNVIRITNRFTGADAGGLAGEMRITAMLLPAAMAVAEESGERRILARELRRFLHTLTRLEIQILICAELGYLDRPALLDLEDRIREVRRQARAGLRDLRPHRARPRANRS